MRFRAKFVSLCPRLLSRWVRTANRSGPAESAARLITRYIERRSWMRSSRREKTTPWQWWMGLSESCSFTYEPFVKCVCFAVRLVDLISIVFLVTFLNVRAGNCIRPPYNWWRIGHHTVALTSLRVQKPISQYTMQVEIITFSVL